MSKRDRVIFVGTLVGGILGAAVGYLLAPPKEPGEESKPSLLASIGPLEAFALIRAGLGFAGQVREVKRKGAVRRGA
jgi:hypothetical protein